MGLKKQNKTKRKDNEQKRKFSHLPTRDRGAAAAAASPKQPTSLRSTVLHNTTQHNSVARQRATSSANLQSSHNAAKKPKSYHLEN